MATHLIACLVPGSEGLPHLSPLAMLAMLAGVAHIPEAPVLSMEHCSNAKHGRAMLEPW
jgi:hypothetical protein